MSHADVLVLGGGAAGLMCAITSAARGRNVVVIERSNRIGKKILMSGGGRCNFTNLYCEPADFISHNPHFCKSALSRYSQHDFIALVEKHGIAYHEKTLGQLFCNNSSKDIVAMLQKECDENGVRIVTSCAVESVVAENSFVVATDLGNYTCNALVIATGGLSIPKMGASGFGFELAQRFGLAVYDTRAALVPFTFTGAMQAMTKRLAGVGIAATVTANGTTFAEDILFTHRGLSGPAMLQISSYWEPGDSIDIDLLPAAEADKLLLAAKSTQPRSLLRNVLSANLPRKLVLELQDVLWAQHADTPVGELADESLRQIAASLKCWRLRPAATEGYRTAEVTLGGVDTRELSSKTLECRKHPGLYFIGEVVDVTGHLGGFNFQWAWASGYAAGLVA